jgi:uncharacterized protein (DUF488 family)
MQAGDSLSVLTIGHSTHTWERFTTLLRGAGITAVADVRTSPYSRRCPHFNRDELRDHLRQDGVMYVFLGTELGGRPKELAGRHELPRGLDSAEGYQNAMQRRVRP